MFEKINHINLTPCDLSRFYDILCALMVINGNSEFRFAPAKNCIRQTFFEFFEKIYFIHQVETPFEL